MGVAVEGITNGAVPAAYGIIGLAVIMVVYETLGGMRSVAWTDVMQGSVLLLGFGILVFLIPQKLGGGLWAGRGPTERNGSAQGASGRA